MIFAVLVSDALTTTLSFFGFINQLFGNFKFDCVP